MEPFLVGLDVWAWRYLSPLRAYAGLHFTARPQACDALLKCIDLLESEDVGAVRTVPLRRLSPEDEAAISGGNAFLSFQRLRLELAAVTEQLGQLSITSEGSLLVIRATSSALPQIRKGFEDVREGTGDYAIEPDLRPRTGLTVGALDRASQCLWFWPCFGHAHPER